MRNRTVITGLGIISAIGNNAEENFDSLKHNRSGLTPMKNIGEGMDGAFLVGDVKKTTEDLRQQLGITVENAFSRGELLGTWAVREALGSAFGEEINPLHHRLSLVNGTAGCPDCGKVTDNIAAYFKLSDKSDLFCDTVTLFSEGSSSLNAIIRATRMVETGITDVAVCGGCEALSLEKIQYLESIGMLSNRPCQPFDCTRMGMNAGEGAAYLVIESEEHALKRGAKILAVLSGSGNACDAYSIRTISKNGEGPFRSMFWALSDAHLRAVDIGYLHAHGTGNGDADSSESYAIKRVFHGNKPFVSSTKSFTGAAFSASGAIDAVLSVLSLAHNFIPVTLGWEHACDHCVEPYVGGEHKELRHVMCNSLSLGGSDSSVIFSIYDEVKDQVLDGVAPEEYQRVTLQGKEVRLPRRLQIATVTDEVAACDISSCVPAEVSDNHSPVVVRALATAVKCCRESHILEPDAIINACAVGNHAGPVVATVMRCHGYNTSYSQGDRSLELAFYDAYDQLLSGRVSNVLVMLSGEITKAYLLKVEN